MEANGLDSVEVPVRDPGPVLPPLRPDLLELSWRVVLLARPLLLLLAGSMLFVGPREAADIDS